MNLYQVTIYNDNVSSKCRKVEFHDLVSEDKDKAREFGKQEAARLFPDDDTAVHVSWLQKVES